MSKNTLDHSVWLWIMTAIAGLSVALMILLLVGCMIEALIRILSHGS